ncbi:hypothetical protein [Moritella dasanensis]|uniref:hypothetical protein n=1 Tax=Moritella dasanensis TaxID=428031 RepID=UPI000474694F|nr:hypothetical protein [Moritella dasanensis]
MRCFILLFVMVVGFNAQASTQVAVSKTVSITSQPSFTPASLLVNAHEDNSVSQDLGESGSEPAPISSKTRHNYEFALTDTTRYSSAGRLVLNNPEPDYQVEIELSIPPSPSLVIGYAVNVNFSQYWLTRSSSKSRISGWKDSNLLYSHRQYPAVTPSV